MNKVQDYFDSLAPRWDEGEIYPESRREELLSRLGIRPGEKVLDLACGTGIITPLLAKLSGSHVDAIDLSSKMIQKAKEKYAGDSRLSFISGDFLDYPFASRYDWVVVYNAYPHFLDVEAFKRKVLEVLNERGKFAIVHSMSAKELSEHHHNVDPSLFREIPSFKEEAEKYEPEFRILKLEEDDHVIVVAEKR